MLAVLAFLAAASMGADSDARDVAMSVNTAEGASVTIDAMPFTRTVTCTGEYTVIGSTNGGTGGVTWSASPSGESGACFDLVPPAFYCDVIVAPDFAGEGVETITIARSGATSATTTIGFYVDGAHSCFLSQSVNGSYNSGLTNADAVATWENLGTSALDVTQGTGSAQPSYRTAVVGGQPVVRCDGGDRVVAAAAADWAFLHDGNGSTVDATVLVTNTGLNTIAATATGAAASRGISYRTEATQKASYYMSDGTALRLSMPSADNAFTANTFNGHIITLASADTPDATLYVNGSSVATGTAAAFSALAPALPFAICALSSGSFPATGDLFRVLIYQSALSSTQRGINKAVDEWALGGTLPVTP
jgi:hypothetical protein